MKYINQNGELFTEEMIRTEHKALRYGYGLFETILVQNGLIMLPAYHLERLLAGMAQLDICIPEHYNAKWLEEQVLKTTTANQIKSDCRVRLQVTPHIEDFAVTGPQTPFFSIECMPIDPKLTAFNEKGLNIGFADGLQKSPDTTSNLKTCNALIYALAARQALKNGLDDTLIKNTHGRVIESTIANLFLIKNERIYTPPLSEGCIAGVMRRYIIDKLAQHDIAVTEKPINEEDVLEADELFLTNAIRRIKWVSSLGEKHYGNNYVQHIGHLLFCL